MCPALVTSRMSASVMYLFGIDHEPSTALPVAAVGIGIGHRIHTDVLSRIVEELTAGEGFGRRHSGACSRDHREDRRVGRRVADREHHLLVFFPMNSRPTWRCSSLLLLRLPPPRRAHLHAARGVDSIKPRFAIKYAESGKRLARAEAAEAEAEATRSGPPGADRPSSRGLATHCGPGGGCAPGEIGGEARRGKVPERARPHVFRMELSGRSSFHFHPEVGLDGVIAVRIHRETFRHGFCLFTCRDSSRIATE